MLKQVLKSGGYNSLLGQGLSSPVTSQAYQMAKGLSSGETKKSNWNVGLLSQAVQQEQEMLQRENDSLKRRMASWKGQVKRNNSTTLRKGDVEKLAKQIVKDYDSTIEWKDLVDDFKSLGEVVARGGEGMSWGEANQQAKDVAQRIVASSQVFSDDDAAALRLRHPSLKHSCCGLRA